MRLADYNQGRRFGNASNQAGAFGFSGFGAQTNNTATNPFGGQTNNTSSPFGIGNQTSNTFGNNNNSGGLFGAKPAGGGLFGANNTTSSQPTNNVFGATASNPPAFGGFGTNASQQQQQPKSGAFSFGSNSNTGGGFGGNTTGFGGTNTTNTSGGIFGSSNQNNAPFGSGPQPQQPASNPFGSTFGTNQNQNQSSAPTFGGFGQNQESKPGGLFSTSNNNTNNTGTGLFGSNNQNNQQQPPASNIFGANNNQQQPTGSNFFSKPAATGTGLFGSNPSSNANNAGGNIFGGLGTNDNANQGQQNQGGLFGTNNQQQQKPSLFNTGSTTNLFGASNNTQQQPVGNSLFGNNSNNQQQQSGGFFGNNSTNLSNSLSGSQQQNSLLAPQTLQASLLDSNPWGSASIFSGLPPPPTQNVGPLATPISAAKSKKQSILHPNYKINPYQSQSRLVTPRRGYGFTYSTYGTPSSISSNASTPGGFSGSLLHSSIGRGLGKSLSTSNLRRTFESNGDSILSPGAFSAGSSRYSGAGSLKKLTIDRSLRTDLFANDANPALPSPDKNDQSKQPGILKKKVSFDTSTVGGNGNGQDAHEVNGYPSNEVNYNATPSAQEQGFLRSSSRNNSGKLNGAKSNGVTSPPEMEQVKGNELAIVHEDGPPEPSSSDSSRPPAQADQNDPQPGSYYMRPSREELDKMSHEQKSQVKDFEIGREGCGHVIFDQPVNLNNVPLDEIYDGIAVITLRSLTIYADSSKKPQRGKGLNVPSTIYLKNSWPRNNDRKTPTYEKSGLRFNRHVERLRKVGGTEFVRYEKDTGVWVFKVPHFTTYGFDYDDDASEGDSLHTSTMSEDPNTPTPKSRAVRNQSTSSELTPLQHSTASTDIPSYVSSSPDDTFEFRKKKMLPGAFDDVPAVDEDQEMEVTQQDEIPFLDDRLTTSPSDTGDDEPTEIQASNSHVEDHVLSVHDDDIEMVGAFPVNDLSLPPKSILKASHQTFDGTGTPKAVSLSFKDDWADQLQKTISPRKQDRQALRGSQAYLSRSQDIEQEKTPRATLTENSGDKDIATSIDLMNSLFGKEQLRRSQRDAKQPSKGKGFEVRHVSFHQL